MTTYLNAAMARDARARATYQAIYGAAWIPLGNGASIDDSATTRSSTVR